MKKQPRLVVFRGKPTAGKTTAYHTIRKLRTLNKWIFLDHPAIKREIDDKEGAKQKFYFELEKAMQTGKNIITEETSRESIMKYVGETVNKLNYKIIIFQFEVSMKTAKIRNVQRAKNWQHPLIEEKEFEELHKMHEKKFDRTAILVDTDKLNRKQTVEFILKKLGE